MILLEKSGVAVAGANALVIGRSILVGRPVASLLLAANATVTVAHSKSRDLPALCGQADIVIAAVGRPEMVRGEWLKPGAAVIDVGRSEEHTSELQSLMRSSYAVFCLKKKK